MATVNIHYDKEAVEKDGYFNLGLYSRQINSCSPAAQIWFDRGLLWSYSFNHEEATRCFERAIRADPDCPMALWGIAYSLGPNYNKPWEIFDDGEREKNLKQARSALKTAGEKCRLGFGGENGFENAMVEALQRRYQAEMPGSEDEAYDAWNADYAEAMSTVYQEFGNDLDVAVLFADSLMNLTPWSLWDLKTGNPRTGSRTLQAKAVLDRALAQPGGDSHPGLLHLYIHLMEMSARPEDALPIADRLRGLVPDAGHLHHMPTHLDVLCGNWQRAISSNSAAIEADERYLARAGALNFYSLYRSHNYHFKIYAAMFAGQFRVAIDTVARLEASLPDQLLRIESPPMADWLESFLSMRVHVLVRFGRWDEIGDLQIPEDERLYCVTTAMIHYGKAIAFSATGKIAEAERERRFFQDLKANVADSRTLFNNTARDILAVAAAMLDGELEYRRENFHLGFEHLRKAVELSDNLPYDEPWGWMQPPRHALGALLLEQHKVEEAAGVYKADLGLDETLPRALRHPNNVWALHGLHECLLQMEYTSEAVKLEKLLEKLQKDADVPITSSCFCRRQTVT